MRSNKWLTGAGVLVILALAGHRLFDTLWMALIPAAFSLSGGMIRWARSAAGSERLATLIVVSATGVLALLALAGLFAQRMLRIEPEWLTQSVSVAGWAFVGGWVLFGFDSARRRASGRGMSLVMATAIPIGLGLDQLLARLPGEFFLASAGLYLGAGLFALGLIHLGTQQYSSANLEALHPGAGRS